MGAQCYICISIIFNVTQNLRQHVLQLNANPIDSASSVIMASAASRSKYNIFINLQLACIFRQPDLVLIFIFLIRFHDQFTRKLLDPFQTFQQIVAKKILTPANSLQLTQLQLKSFESLAISLKHNDEQNDILQPSTKFQTTDHIAAFSMVLSFNLLPAALVCSRFQSDIISISFRCIYEEILNC